MAITVNLAQDVYDVTQEIIKQIQDNINPNMTKIASELVTRNSGLDFSYMVKETILGQDIYLRDQDVQIEDIDIVPPVDFPCIRVIPLSEEITEPSGSSRKGIANYSFKLVNYMTYPYMYDNDASASDPNHINFASGITLANLLLARAVRNILIENIKGKSGIYLVTNIQTNYLETGAIDSLNLFIKASEIYFDALVKVDY